MSLPTPPNQPAIPASEVQVSRVLLALNEAGHLLSPTVKARAVLVVQLAAAQELHERIETEFINRQLAQRPQSCPELEDLMNRLMPSKSS